MKRRSATQGTPRRRYTDDPFAAHEILRDLEDDDVARLPQEDDDTDVDEFQVAIQDSSSEDEVLQSGGPDEGDGESEGGERVPEKSASDGVDQDDEVYGRLAKRIRRPKPKPEGVPTYTRPTGDTWHGDNKSLRQLHQFGRSQADIGPVHAAKIKWAFDPALPSRTADKDNFGGMHRSFFVSDEQRMSELEKGRKWWVDEGGRDAFLNKQSLVDIDDDQAADYMPERVNGAFRFLMGPYKNQQILSLPVGGHVPLRQAWHTKPQSGDSGPKSYKDGFMLYLGARIQCLDWAPNQNGRDQYLAVSVMPERDPDHAPFEAPSAPSFSPQPQYGSTLQIWRFRSTKNGFIDTQVAPELVIVLCGAWGEAKEVKWCPLPLDGSEQNDGQTLGLVAGIWSDGSIRILHVTLPLSNNTTSHLYVQECAFESQPPSTVCTCLTWIGGDRIAAGCANGCVAVWDLPSSIKTGSPNPRPSIYSSICTSYVLSVQSCYPSRPNLLISSSISGYTSISDLSRSGQSLCSHASTVISARSRVGHSHFLWHDYSQAILHVDEMFVLRGAPIRRIFQLTSLGRYKSNATSLAASLCHPCILVGTASGEVIAQNPTRKVIDGRKAAIWQQTWFAHEWRRSLERNDASTDEMLVQDGYDDNDHAPGMSRISEGFKVERVLLTNEERGQHMSKDGVTFATMYEEKSAVTALAWNPNLHVGGWAAAGMGDGLLRVEDIATLNMSKGS